MNQILNRQLFYCFISVMSDALETIFSKISAVCINS